MLTPEEQILEKIKKSKNILIAFPKDLNGDATTSSLALFLVLKKLNKNVQIITNKINRDIVKKLNFLPNLNQITNKLKTSNKFIISLDLKKTKVKNIKYELKDDKLNFIINPQNGFFTKQDVSAKQNIDYDLIITLNTPNLKSLKELYEENENFFNTIPIVNIDNNLENKNYGKINLIKTKKSSACEILFYFIYKNYPQLINENVATYLLCGIISKTRNFKTLNIMPNTLASAAKLISLKGNRDKIVKNLYISRDIKLMKAIGDIFAKLQSELNNKLIWFNLKDSHTDNTKDIILEIINELTINIPQVEIIIAFYKKLNDNKNYILVYSNKGIDALNLTTEFKPNGTKNSAFIATEKSFNEIKNIILEKSLNKLKNSTP